MIFLANGLYISPMPFLWGRLLPFARAERERDDRQRHAFSRAREGAPAPDESEKTTERRECSAVSSYQMGCFAQQMSGGGFDAAPGLRCACECSGGRCIERMR